MPFPFPSPSMPFPTYLVPSLKFRKRKSSTDSTASTSSASSAASDPSTTSPEEPSPTFLNGHSARLRCSRCLSDLALAGQIISKGFTGRHGRAYLVSPSTSSISPNPIWASSTKAKNDALPNLPNTYTHRPVPRQLVTGAHTVSDISCSQCSSVLGWKYVAADEESQKYKVGKFILETKRVCKSTSWEDDQGEEASPDRMPDTPRRARFEEDEIEFDSQDEEECEDLFMGQWTPQTAAKRRRMKQFA